MSSVSDKSSKKVSKTSKNLSKVENEQVFKLFRSGCLSLCTTLAKVSIKEPPDLKSVKSAAGVLCFIKDYKKRAFFFQLYCLIKNNLIWEQEINDQAVVIRNQPKMMTIESKACAYILNFIHEDEAENFFQITSFTVESRKRKNNAKSNENIATSSDIYDDRNKKQKKLLISKTDISKPVDFRHLSHTSWNNDKAMQAFLKKAGVSEDQLQDDETRNLIENFIQTHNVEEAIKNDKMKISNVGTTAQTNNNRISSKNQERTNNYGSLGRNNDGVSGASNKVGNMFHSLERPRRPPPPVPKQKVLTLPPVNRSKPPSVVSRPAPSKPNPVLSTPPTVAAPPPPPPIGGISPPLNPTLGPIPPPPPLNPSKTLISNEISNSIPPTSPSGGDGRADLLKQIQNGKKLKKVGPPAEKSLESTISSNKKDESFGGDGNDLIKQIQMGVKLKKAQERKVKEKPRPKVEMSLVDQLSIALNNAMLLREEKIRGISNETLNIIDDTDWP